LRPDDRAADGGDGRDLPGARGQDEALGRLPQPPRARQPARALGQGRSSAREGARRRAGALPRVSAPCDHAQARDDARPDRPALQAAWHLARSSASGDELDDGVRIPQAPDLEVGLDLHARPGLVRAGRSVAGALAAVVAAWRPETEEDELDLLAA